MKKQLLYILTITTAFALNAQVTLLKEINSTTTVFSGNSNPANLIAFNGKIFFSANNGVVGTELWTTDGTETGTVLVKDIRTGTATTSSSPNNFFQFNNKLYFTAFSTSSELWTTDGTEAETTLVDLMPSITGESPQRFVELGGLAYFTVGGQPGTGAETTNKLVQWDGGDTSTSPAVQVADAGAGYESVLSEMAVLNNKLIIYMNYSTDDATIGNELYNYDPSTDLFTLIKDIEEGPGDSGISNFVLIGSELYFESGSGILWKTDGTTAGTVAVTAAASISGATNLFNWNGKLYFEGDAGAGDQLYVYDPIENTLTNISNISGGTTTNDHDPSDYAVLGNFMYYAGEVADDTKQYLFRTDGITVERVSSTIFDIDDLAVLNGKLYFEGDNNTTGNELYMLDPATLSATLSSQTISAEIIKVYPNPASDYIMVSKALVNAPYSIFDATGKAVKQGVITSERINLNLNTGLYFLKVNTDATTITKKILVK